MYRFLQISVILVGSILQQSTAITIDECTKTEVSFTVTGGQVGGKTFIEGTGITNAECFPDITGSPETFTMRYAECGVTPTELALGTTIKFVIIVQASPIINTITDDRYAVDCSFGESTTTIDVELLTSSTAPISYIQKPFTNSPTPEMFLYYQANDTWVDNNVVPLGTPVTLSVVLNSNLPFYNIIVEHCTMDATDLGGVTLPNQVSLVSIVTKCSELPTQFPSFTYVTYPDVSTSGDTFDAPMAFSEFDVFTPTLIGHSLTAAWINIRISCRVRVCISTVCAPINCTDPARRRRDADDTPTNDTVYNLNEFYRVSFGMNGNDVTGYEIGENDVCMDNYSFYGMLLSLLALLVASWALMCCMFMFIRRRKRKGSKKITVVDSSSTKISTLTPDQSTKTIPIALPRYFPVTVGSFTDRSGSA